jgi:hypothetical protein
MSDHTADIHAAANLTAASQDVTTGITALAVPRVMSITGSAAGMTGDVVFTGTDWTGAAATDTLALDGGNTVFGSVALIPTQITLPAQTHASGDAVSCGWQDMLFTLAEARAFNGGALSDVAGFLSADILGKESEIREWLEDVCGVAFIPTESTFLVDGVASNVLHVPAKNPTCEAPRRPLAVSAASIDGVALTATELAAVKAHANGRLARTDGGNWSGSTGYQDLAVSITVAYGWSTVPALIRDAALKILITELPATNVTFAAERWDEGGMAVSFGRGDGYGGNWHRIPDVVKAIRLYNEQAAVVA